jgi:hypothetical protein|eukprot:SAG25_NODE_1263_length_3466_cov_2.420552_5_plen_47_part_00
MADANSAASKPPEHHIMFLPSDTIDMDADGTSGDPAWHPTHGPRLT